MSIGYRKLVIAMSAWIAVACTTDDATDAEPEPAPEASEESAPSGDGESDSERTLTVIKSGLGESCLVSDHCDTDLGLVCVGNTCVDPKRGNGTMDRDAGSAPLPSRLGQVSESCRARIDCDLGLACIANICVPIESVSAPHLDAGTAQLAAGQEGESCTARSDCAQGLACLSGRCARGSSGLEPTGKECVVIECQDPVDCCPEPPSTCPTLESYCLASPGSTSCQQFEQLCQCDGTYFDCTDSRCLSVQCREAADCCPAVSSSCPLYEAECAADPESTYCDAFDTSCVCDESRYRCTADQCETVYPCASATDCPTAMVCDAEAGVCVGCLSSADCGSGTCTDNVCASGCERDEQCPLFHQCADGECVDVGCQTDRECKAYTGDQQAICQDGECQVQCSSDFECSSSMVCVDGTCVSAGCETDEECRIQLGGVVTAYDIECRAIE
jgi:hypothetical protein